MRIYGLIRNQVRVTAMGEVVGLDYGAVLNVVKLYVKDDEEARRIFENVLICYQTEKELDKGR